MHAPLVELAGQNEQTRAQTIAKLFIALDTARKFATPSNRHIPVNTHVSVEAKRLFSKEHEEAVKKYLLEQYNKEHGTNINNFDELEKKEEFKEWLKKKYNVRAWEALVPAVDVIVDENGRPIMENANLKSYFKIEGNIDVNRLYKEELKRNLEIQINNAIINALVALSQNPEKPDLAFQQLKNQLESVIYSTPLSDKDKADLIHKLRNGTFQKIKESIEKMISEKREELEKLRNELSQIEEQIKKEKDENKKKELQQQWLSKYVELTNKAQIELPKEELEEKLEEIKKELEDRLEKKQFMTLSQYTMQKVPETIAKLAALNFAESEALKALGLEKYDKTPIIAIENVFPEFFGSRSGELVEIIKESREKVKDALDKLVKAYEGNSDDPDVKEFKLALDRIKLYLKSEYGEKADEILKTMIEKAKELRNNEAKLKEYSEKYIGTTLDNLHTTMLLGKHEGYTVDDLLKEYQKIIDSKTIKHLHIVDGWLGEEDAHLAPGSGIMPIKEIYERLKQVNPQLELLEKDPKTLKEVLDRTFNIESPTFVFEAGNEITLLESLGQREGPVRDIYKQILTNMNASINGISYPELSWTLPYTVRVQTVAEDVYQMKKPLWSGLAIEKFDSTQEDIYK